jgi:diguanylate cyclase (GGDEF)-like protein
VLRWMRDHIPLSVVLLDIDHFKSINDTFGHHVGDQVILAMARSITGQTRHVDCAIRWGGEEFLILLHGCDLGSAYQTTQRILTAFKGKAIEGVSDGRIATASAGISGGRVPKQPQEIEPWIQAADVLLYEAKRTGRDRIVSKYP